MAQSKIYEKAYACCQVESGSSPVRCYAKFQVTEADLQQGAGADTDVHTWAEIEATKGACDKAEARCRCVLDTSTNTMVCRCYDPSALF